MVKGGGGGGYCRDADDDCAVEEEKEEEEEAISCKVKNSICPFLLCKDALARG
jgi:hypothetical protein